jgi:hypothetical protein
MMRSLGAGVLLALSALLPAQQAAAQDPLAGAIIGGALGGIIGGAAGRGAGGAFAGAAIGARPAPSSPTKRSGAPAAITGGMAAAITSIRTVPGCRSRRIIAATEPGAAVVRFRARSG